ncbi:acyltransferase domain-containing protein [Streptomyces sp. NPDC018031]|uniref:acyltransferase domain-containing protein n=1 Tax=Streptomyces sp. NPDC018031 TaxID=3365033 RepID=UPI0037AC895E
MTLAYVLDGGMNDQPGAGSELYELFPVVRQCYEQIEAWTGLDAQRIFTEEREPGQQHRQGIGAIRQAAAVFGIADVLAEEYGITPGAVCGLSFGALVGASLAGSVEREDLFRLLMRMREMPVPPSDGATAQGVAAVRLPYDLDLDERLAGVADVYLSADLGRIGTGSERMVLLAGYRTALADFGTRLPPGTLQISDEHGFAFHSPLQQEISDFLEPTLREMTFRDPKVPVHSCMDVKTLTTGEEIRDLYRRNPTDPVSVPHMINGLERAGTELGLVLGPCSFGTFLGSSFPVVHVQSPDHVFEAMTAIYELGIELDSTEAVGR